MDLEDLLEEEIDSNGGKNGDCDQLFPIPGTGKEHQCRDKHGCDDEKTEQAHGLNIAVDDKGQKKDAGDFTERDLSFLFFKAFSQNVRNEQCYGENKEDDQKYPWHEIAAKGIGKIPVRESRGKDRKKDTKDNQYDYNNDICFFHV